MAHSILIPPNPAEVAPNPMMITLSSVLTPDQVRQVISLASGLSWRDGATTAGAVARQVKRNEQAELTGATGTAAKKILTEAIERHPVLRAAAQPRRFSTLMISRASNGGGYGRHVDNAFMGTGDRRLRTDLSFTLFLSDPSTYEGGELAIDTLSGEHVVKPEAGTLSSILLPRCTKCGPSPRASASSASAGSKAPCAMPPRGRSCLTSKTCAPRWRRSMMRNRPKCSP
jgi:predicted 2-oxoglutarate/Fe(II)-dependent dioxygenase YbiX